MRSHCCLLTFCLEEKKKNSSLISSARVYQICVCTAFPVYCLCGYWALIAVCSRQEKINNINPNACLTIFENTKKQSCAQPDCLHEFASHMRNYSRRWQINYLLWLCVTMIYNVRGCESKISTKKKWRVVENAGEERVVKKLVKKESAPKAIFLICHTVFLNQT